MLLCVSRQTTIGNEVTPRPLSTREQPARRTGPGGGIGPEAKAPGKAGGYADGAHERMEGGDTRRRILLSTPATGVQEWRDIPWPQVERDVHTLQRRIYRASLRRVASIPDKDYSPEEPDERESLTSGSEDQPGG